MKVLHLNAGNETGGGMVHILSLLNQFNREEFYLGLLEKGVFEQKAIGLGIRTLTFEQSSRYDFSVLSKIINFIKKEQIDILHTHGARANLYGYLISKFTDITWMTTIHSDPRNDFLGRGIIGNIFTKLNLMVLKKPDHYFAISDRFTEMLVEFGVSRNKISTILNGIDFNQKTKSIISRKDLKLSQDDFVLLMVARFDPVKRHELAISAVKSVLNSEQNVRLLLIGNGPTEPSIKEYVNQQGLEQHVIFLGYQENIADYFKLADVGILTSKTESFPLVLLEASRERKTVITTDVGGVQKMIPNHTYGLILRDDQVETISAAIKKTIELKKTGELGEMGARFYHYTASHFSVEAFAESVYKVYKQTV
ncbi:glycosyltransferase family 4 protein [Bacillus marasmi]|uniref:glycosyltransferase family 4 protein n=1 Tax=Bacillus marasmi TaxID=1926279 RepID=UPI0011CB7FB2|nr:glycosyltransferase family 4 protein [Bacillus marasmi]